MHGPTIAHPALDQTPLPFRGDTMLGVCEALGQDFGFHPNWLRLAFAAPVLWNPWIAFGLYLGLGAIVALSRLIAPHRRAAAPELVSESGSRPEQDNSEQLAIAA